MRTFSPANYTRQPPIDIGRPVEKSHMINFFLEFMESDQLGRIAVQHRIKADQKDSGTLDAECITLAEMHSTAVDFSKTGIPVVACFVTTPYYLTDNFRSTCHDYQSTTPTALILKPQVRT